MRSRRTTVRLEGGFGDPPSGRIVSGDGDRLLAWGAHDVGNRPDVWVVWDLRTGEELSAQTAHGGAGGALTRSGRLMVWSDDDGLATYRVSDGKLLARHPGLTAGAISPTGVTVASAPDGSLHVLDARTLRSSGPPLAGSPGPVQQLTFSADGSLLAARGADGRVRLLDMASRSQLGEPIELTTAGDRSIALRPDGLALAMAGADGLLVWDLRPARLKDAACRYAGRTLTRQEWQTLLRPVGGYRPACPGS